MKRIGIFTAILLCNELAYADWKLQFNDGTANVWDQYYEKGKEFCTKKEFGEYCVQKADIVSVKQVPAGTKASEYEITSETGDASERDQKRDENIAALKSLNCTQLKATNTKAAKAQYRNECFTPAEKEAYNKKVQQDQESRREAYRDYKDSQREFREQQRDQQREWAESQRAAKEFQRDLRDQERDRKIDRIDKTLNGW